LQQDYSRRRNPFATFCSKPRFPAGNLVLELTDVDAATTALATDAAGLITGKTIDLDDGLHVIGERLPNHT